MTNVSKYIQYDSSNGNTYYTATGNIDNDKIINLNGKEGKLKAGMICEAKLIIERERVLYYLLEKVGLR